MDCAKFNKEGIHNFMCKQNGTGLLTNLEHLFQAMSIMHLKN